MFNHVQTDPQDLLHSVLQTNQRGASSRPRPALEHEICAICMSRPAHSVDGHNLQNTPVGIGTALEQPTNWCEMHFVHPQNVWGDAHFELIPLTEKVNSQLFTQVAT